jgi:UDP-2,3-diacylglucosamine pyrophosphatase LpxH
MSCYVMGDPHAGLYAWDEEAGENYNLQKWADEHRAAMVELVDSAPASNEAVIVNLGDFFHADDHKSVTPGSGHSLDVDTRHAKVFREGCRTFEFLIDEALRKHQSVTVYVTKGNHDPESSFALAEVLRAVYRKEPRVEIRGGIAYREYHQFGCNLIGITHGDKAKPAQLSQVMAAEKPAEWGAATCRRWLVGHFHHQDRKEYPGCIVEIFPTLARNDAWHSGMGYLSEKAMTCIVFDKDHGEKGRRIVGIRELTA